MFPSKRICIQFLVHHSDVASGLLRGHPGDAEPRQSSRFLSYPTRITPARSSPEALRLPPDHSSSSRSQLPIWHCSNFHSTGSPPCCLLPAFRAVKRCFEQDGRVLIHPQLLKSFFPFWDWTLKSHTCKVSCHFLKKERNHLFSLNWTLVLAPFCWGNNI